MLLSLVFRYTLQIAIISGLHFMHNCHNVPHAMMYKHINNMYINEVCVQCMTKTYLFSFAELENWIRPLKTLLD